MSWQGKYLEAGSIVQRYQEVVFKSDVYYSRTQISLCFTRPWEIWVRDYVLIREQGG